MLTPGTRIRRVGIIAMIFIYWSPTPRVTFERADGQHLPVGRTNLDNFDTKLVISNVQEEDEGEYICYATNVAGRSENVTIFLDVQGKIRFSEAVC